MSSEPLFLTLDEVLSIHHDQIARYGGASGVRDLDLLKSALGTPSVTFGGAYLHQSLAEMCAAYLFHIAQNHPFVDGKKRTALASALLFFWMNDTFIEAHDDDLYAFVLAVAAGKKTKSEAAVFFAEHATPL